ncbi:hypothetical protein GCM10022235_37770 [Kribbella ginsengisoli]|uniref:Secreted protein n=1 Tax=Kribbella ginsengisoli TaxID=363865 RepID=A0ABP6XI06_9ACTN
MAVLAVDTVVARPAVLVAVLEAVLRVGLGVLPVVGAERRVPVGLGGMTSRLRSGTRAGTTRATRDATRSRDSSLTATTADRVATTAARPGVTTVHP